MDDISQVHLAAQFGIYLRYISEDGEWLPEEAVGGLRDPLIPVHSDVLKAARSYRQAQRVDDLIGYMKPGICRGLCTVKAACCLAGKDELYESLLVQISLWDGAPRSLSDVVSIDDRRTRLGDLFNQFVETTLYTQNSQFLGASTFALKQEYAGQIHPSKPSMMVAGYFAEDDFETFLNRFKSGGLIILTDAKHMCTLQKVISNKVTVYLFYDPNNLEGAKKFTDIHPLFLYISEILSNSLAIQFLSQETADSFVSLQSKYDERAHPGWLYGSGLMVVARYTPEKISYLLAMVKTSDQVDQLIRDLGSGPQQNGVEAVVIKAIIAKVITENQERYLMNAFKAMANKWYALPSCEQSKKVFYQTLNNSLMLCGLLTLGNLVKIIDNRELQRACCVTEQYLLNSQCSDSSHGKKQMKAFFNKCVHEDLLTPEKLQQHAFASLQGSFLFRQSSGRPGSRKKFLIEQGILKEDATDVSRCKIRC